LHRVSDLESSDVHANKRSPSCFKAVESEEERTNGASMQDTIYIVSLSSQVQYLQ